MVDSFYGGEEERHTYKADYSRNYEKSYNENDKENHNLNYADRYTNSAQARPLARFLDGPVIDSRAQGGDPRVNFNKRFLSLYERKFDRYPFSLTVADPHQTDCPIIYVNQRFVSLTGFDHNEVVGKNCRLLQGCNTDRSVFLAMQSCLDNDELFHGDVTNYRKDGTAFVNRLLIKRLSVKNYSLYLASQCDVTLEVRSTMNDDKKEGRALWVRLAGYERLMHHGCDIAESLESSEMVRRRTFLTYCSLISNYMQFTVARYGF